MFGMSLDFDGKNGDIGMSFRIPAIIAPRAAEFAGLAPRVPPCRTRPACWRHGAGRSC